MLYFQLDSKHSLDYITEMHQITAMCINIRPNEHEIRDYITFVDEIYKEMNSLVLSFILYFKLLIGLTIPSDTYKKHGVAFIIFQ